MVNCSYGLVTSFPPFILGFTKRENTYCRWNSDIYGTYQNLHDAISACKADTNCGKIYDNGCNNHGTIKLCKKNAKTKKSNKGSCIYERPLGKHRYL